LWCLLSIVAGGTDSLQPNGWGFSRVVGVLHALPIPTPPSIEKLFNGSANPGFIKHA
jgi:hypothetical protein